VAIVAGAGALIFNELLLARVLSSDGTLDSSSVLRIRIFQGLLLATAVVVAVFRNVLADRIQRIVSVSSEPTHARGASALALAIAVPWVALLLLSETTTRLQWMWPLQAIALAASVTHLLRRCDAPRWLTPLAATALIVLVATNPLLRSRLQSWAGDGWSGRDAVEIQVVDALARDLGAGSTASIGYEIETKRFKAMYNILDDRYKAGADFDLLLRYRHGIRNQNRCAEGVSPADTYRVVQTAPRDTSEEGRHRTLSTRPGGFAQVHRAGIYDILARDTKPQVLPATSSSR
jgi:hypothetical protein